MNDEDLFEEDGDNIEENNDDKRERGLENENQLNQEEQHKEEDKQYIIQSTMFFLNFLNLVLLQLLFIILYSCSIEKCIFGNKNPSLYRKEFMSNSYHYLGFMVNEYVL